LSIKISSKKVLLWLLAILILLITLHITGQYLWHIRGLTDLSLYIDRFNMNEENSLPTWFATILLLVSSGLMYIIASSVKKNSARYWKALSLIFLLLSIDEASSIHELLSSLTSKALHITEGFLFYAWIIPIGIVLAIFLLIFFRFWWNLFPKTRFLMGLAAVVYVSGAMGIESISRYYITKLGGYDFNYFLLVMVEEGLEKLGLIILIYALLNYLSQLKSESRVVFVK
jgi:hypothetical protein